MIKYFITLLFFFSLLYVACTTQPAGTEVENEVFSARVVNSDGSGAGNVTVTVLPVNFIPGSGGMAKSLNAIIRKTTDHDGYFNVEDLEEDCYNFYAMNGRVAAYKDSVSLPKHDRKSLVLTLDSTRTIEGRVDVQPNHDPRIVEVQILGTNYYANASFDGVFVFPDLALGEYQFRFYTSNEDYVATYSTVSIDTGIHGDTVLLQPVEMIYTGIPVVNGVTAAFDSSSGLFTLSWEKTTYRDFYEYVIYRDADGATQPSIDPVAVTQDTVFIDSVFRKANGSYRFRVAIRNNSMECGPTYGSTVVTTPSYSMEVSAVVQGDRELYLGDTVQIVLHVHCEPFSPEKIFWVNYMYPSDTGSLAWVNPPAGDTGDAATLYSDTIDYVVKSSLAELMITVSSIEGKLESNDSLYLEAVDTIEQPIDTMNILRIYTEHSDTFYQNDSIVICLDTTGGNMCIDSSRMRITRTDFSDIHYDYIADSLYVFIDTTKNTAVDDTVATGSSVTDTLDDDGGEQTLSDTLEQSMLWHCDLLTDSCPLKKSDGVCACIRFINVV